MEKQVCAYCFNWIQGGVSVEQPDKKLYFCSLNCLEKQKEVIKK